MRKLLRERHGATQAMSVRTFWKLEIHGQDDRSRRQYRALRVDAEMIDVLRCSVGLYGSEDEALLALEVAIDQLVEVFKEELRLALAGREPPEINEEVETAFELAAKDLPRVGS